jgi:DNA-binding FadR family transcriptional regulator
MEEIKAKDWPIGECIGTEAELMKRFNVARATIIEAARQVEGHGAATMRRGSGGGLFVTNSALATAARAISIYLELANVTVAEQYEAALIIEAEAARRAAMKVTEAQALELRNVARQLTEAEDGVQLHTAAMRLRIAIAEAGGGLPLGLFMRALARIVTNYVRPDLRTQNRDVQFEHAIVADMLGVVEAIVGGDAELADRATRQDVERREQRARVLAVAQPALERGPLRWSSASKLNEKIAFAIRNDIAKRGWQVGERIANESELSEQYDGSPWVVRQAARLLELHGIVHIRRGQGGGLFVGQPSPDYTVDTAVSFLRAIDVRSSGVLDLRYRLFQCVAQFAVIRARPEDAAGSATLLASSDLSVADAHRQMLDHLIGTGRNRVLGLFCAILNRFIETHGGGELFVGAPALLRGTLEAVTVGDGPLARRRIGEYLKVA